MLDFAEENPDTDHYFWCDMFVNNQHAEALHLQCC
jgi:hypothetical protein